MSCMGANLHSTSGILIFRPKQTLIIMIATQTAVKSSNPAIPLIPVERKQNKKNLVLRKREVRLTHVIDEYGYMDTGIFAVSLARAYGLGITVILYQGFPIHIFCEASTGYVDAFGIHNPTEFIESVKREYGLGTMVSTEANTLRVVRVTEQVIRARYSKYSEDDILVADKCRLIFESVLGKDLLVPA